VPQTELRAGFAPVGHHVLPPFPLYAPYAGDRPAALTKLPLGAAHVLSGVEARHERCGVVRYVFDRGAVRGHSVLVFLKPIPSRSDLRIMGEGRPSAGYCSLGHRGDPKQWRRRAPWGGRPPVDAGGAGGKSRRRRRHRHPLKNVFFCGFRALPCVIACVISAAGHHYWCRGPSSFRNPSLVLRHGSLPLFDRWALDGGRHRRSERLCIDTDSGWDMLLLLLGRGAHAMNQSPRPHSALCAWRCTRGRADDVERVVAAGLAGGLTEEERRSWTRDGWVDTDDDESGVEGSGGRYETGAVAVALLLVFLVLGPVQ